MTHPILATYNTPKENSYRPQKPVAYVGGRKFGFCFAPMTSNLPIIEMLN